MNGDDDDDDRDAPDRLARLREAKTRKLALGRGETLSAEELDGLLPAVRCARTRSRLSRPANRRRTLADLPVFTQYPLDHEGSDPLMPEIDLNDPALVARARVLVLSQLARGARTGSELSTGGLRWTPYRLAADRDVLLSGLVADGLVTAALEPWGYRKVLTLTYRLAEPKGPSPDERT